MLSLVLYFLISFIIETRMHLSASALRHLRFNHKFLTETSTRKQRANILTGEGDGYDSGKRAKLPYCYIYSSREAEMD